MLKIALFSFVLFSAFSLASVKTGQKAPDFSIKNSSGNEISLKQFTGKFVVLEWHNKDCPYVKKHYKSGNMQNLQKSYTKQNVAWLTIVSSAPKKQGYLAEKEAKNYQKELSSSDLLLDPQGRVGKMYGAKTTPHMFIINPQGKLIYQGAIDDQASTDPDDIKNSKNYVSETLDLALAGKPIKVGKTNPYGCSVKYE